MSGETSYRLPVANYAICQDPSLSLSLSALEPFPRVYQPFRDVQLPPFPAAPLVAHEKREEIARGRESSPLTPHPYPNAYAALLPVFSRR